MSVRKLKRKVAGKSRGNFGSLKKESHSFVTLPWDVCSCSEVLFNGGVGFKLIKTYAEKKNCIKNLLIGRLFGGILKSTLKPLRTPQQSLYPAVFIAFLRAFKNVFFSTPNVFS